MGNLGKYKIAIDPADLSNGDSIASYLTDAAGALLTSTLLAGKQRLDTLSASDRADNTARVSGDYGTSALAVRTDTAGTLASADGNYAPLQLDANGRLRVVADIDVNNDFVFAEDSASSSGHQGASVLLVRQDTLASSTSTDGDFGDFKSNNLGELYVFDTTTHSTLSTINTSLGTINTSINAFTHLEDAGHVSGDAGVFALAVRNDANTVLTSTDLDYSPIAVDSSGRVKVTGTLTATIAGQYAEDSASVSGDIGLFTLAVRNDANSSLVNANGDYGAFQLTSTGYLKVNDRMDGTNLQQLRTVANTATLLPATALADRKHILIQNIGSKKLYIGSATVTSSGATQGVEVPVNSFWEGDVGPDNLLYGIVNTGTNDVIIWELS